MPARSVRGPSRLHRSRYRRASQGRWRWRRTRRGTGEAGVGARVREPVGMQRPRHPQSPRAARAGRAGRSRRAGRRLARADRRRPGRSVRRCAHRGRGRSARRRRRPPPPPGGRSRARSPPPRSASSSSAPPRSRRWSRAPRSARSSARPTGAGWSARRTIITGLATLWPSASAITARRSCSCSTNLRQLTLDQIRNGWFGLFHLLRNLGLVRLARPGEQFVQWVHRLLVDQHPDHAVPAPVVRHLARARPVDARADPRPRRVR